MKGCVGLDKPFHVWHSGALRPEEALKRLNKANLTVWDDKKGSFAAWEMRSVWESWDRRRRDDKGDSVHAPICLY
jgi:hypothetical protein